MSALLLAMWLSLGCGGTTPSSPDAAESDGATVTNIAPAALPTLTPCPTGWREVTSASGLVTCDPYPESGPADCGPGEAHFAGEPGCTNVGPPCPEGDFPEDLPAGRSVRYVQAGATAGDGTLARPFGRIADASDSAPAGTIVAIAKGTYDETLVLYRGVTLWGACAAETILAPSVMSARSGAISPIGSEIEIRAITIRPTALVQGIFIEGDAPEVTLDGVIVEDATSSGITVAVGAELVARSVVVRDTRSRPDGQFGTGLDLVRATAELERSVFERNRYVGVSAQGPTTELRLDGVVVRETAIANGHGRGLGVGGGATADVRRSVLDGNTSVAAAVVDHATLRMEDSFVRGARDASPGWALTVEEASRGELRRTLVGELVEVGVRANGAESTLVLENVVVRDVASNAAGELGVGVAADAGASAELRAVALERSHSLAVIAFGTGTRMVASDLTILDIESQASDGFGGRAITVQTSASITAERVRIERAREVSVYAGSSARLELTDTLVSDTLPRGCTIDACRDEPGGTGVVANGAASTTLTRFGILRTPLCGVQITNGSAIDLHDGEIAESAIGACIQVDGYDIARLSDRVRYRGNGANLQSTTLPVPGDTLPL